MDEISQAEELIGLDWKNKDHHGREKGEGEEGDCCRECRGGGHRQKFCSPDHAK